MKTIEFEDKIKVTDSMPSTKAPKPVRGIVSAYDREGNLVFERENTITLAGRQYLYNLVADRMFKKNNDELYAEYTKPTVKYAARSNKDEARVAVDGLDLSSYSIRKIFFGGNKVSGGATKAEKEGVDFNDVGLLLRSGNTESTTNGRVTKYTCGITGQVGAEGDAITGIVELGKENPDQFIAVDPSGNVRLGHHTPLLYDLTIGENFFAENDVPGEDTTDTYIEAGIVESQIPDANGYKYRLTIKVLNLGINLKSPEDYTDIDSVSRSYYNGMQAIKSLGLVISPQDTLKKPEVREDDIIFSYLDDLGENTSFNIGGDNIFTIVYRVEF